MPFREIIEDIGWIALILLVLPLAIPLGGLAFAFLLGQRVYAWSRGRMRSDFAGDERTTTLP